MINQESNVPSAGLESAARSLDTRPMALSVIDTTRNDWASRPTADEPVVKRTSSRSDRAD